MNARLQAAPVSDPVGEYLRSLERLLWIITPRHRREFLRDIRTHLLDEVEELGLSGKELARHLAEAHPSPRALAREIRKAHFQDAASRCGDAIILAVAVPAVFCAWVAFNSNGNFYWDYAYRHQLGRGVTILLLGLLQSLWSGRKVGKRIAIAMGSGFVVGTFVSFGNYGMPNLDEATIGAFLGLALERVLSARNLLRLIFDPVLVIASLWGMETLSRHLVVRGPMAATPTITPPAFQVRHYLDWMIVLGALYIVRHILIRRSSVLMKP